MRVVYSYGVIGGGGCEKRMGDLVRWLVDGGDEAWILGSCIDAQGQAQLFGQQGFDPDRLLLFDAQGDVKYTIPNGYSQWITDVATSLGADILDVQYTTTTPAKAPCRMVYTLHGCGQPIPDLVFDGILSVESVEHPFPIQHANQHFRHVNNWVDTERFPWQKELGEGACFIGRNFKTVNALKVAAHWDGVIDCYGIAETSIVDWPKNMRWLGYGDPAEILPRYRVVFGSAQVALEALAMGRYVIAGQHYIFPPGGSLVTPQNIATLAGYQFYTQQRGEKAVEPSGEQVYAEFQRAMTNDNPKDRWKMSEYVRENHDPDIQMDKVRDFYEEVLA